MCGKSKVSFNAYFNNTVPKSFELAMQDSHPSLYNTKNCINLYISDPLWKLTALIKLVWNIQKITWTNLFEYHSKMFLNIENVLVKIREEQP